MIRTADISDCGKFRWRLERRWADGPVVCFVMLNPSVADALQDDPTVRRCIAFAQAWGFSGLSVLNLYPFRATKVSDLKKAMKSIDVTGGERGNGAFAWAMISDLVIAAWGSHASAVASERFFAITDPKPIWCLALNDDWTPVHPLYQKKTLTPMQFHRAEGLDWRDALKAS